MAMKSALEKLSVFLNKYKYAVLVLLIGLALMLIPKASEKKAVVIIDDKPLLQVDFESKLSSILSCVDGAGEVRVILTLQQGEETIYQTNDQTTSKDGATNRTDTVTVTDSGRNESGLVKQVVPASYKGAIVICQGADNPSVKYNIITAVSKLIGIGANNISVLKMK